MSIDLDRNHEQAPSVAEIAICLGCASPLGFDATCSGCGRDYPFDEGILSAIGELSGNNRVAASFFDGPGWTRFRPWERMFLRLVGGQAKARREILSKLPTIAFARVLEVGIGDGENVDLLPDGWTLYGADIARTQLVECSRRFPRMIGRLAWAEAESLPFPPGSFDASYTIGGFNYFRDPGAALSEMRRVTRPGGVVVVADERPDLKRFGLGHLIGLKAIDGWWMRRVGLPADFVRMVMETQIDPVGLMREALSPEATRASIWKGLGYCLVEPDTRKRTSP